jgi:hypothetical protein
LRVREGLEGQQNKAKKLSDWTDYSHIDKGDTVNVMMFESSKPVQYGEDSFNSQ